ncbi:unnamed protein product [Urochloa humidicola]
MLFGHPPPSVAPGTPPSLGGPQLLPRRHRFGILNPCAPSPIRLRPDPDPGCSSFQVATSRVVLMSKRTEHITAAH